MAIRRPLYYEKNVIDSDGTITQINLKEMADSDITAMRDYCNWVYSRYPITGAVGLGNNADAYLNGTGTGTQKYWQDSWHSLTDTRRIPSTGTDHPHSFQGAGGSVSLYAPNTYQFETFWPKNPLTDTDSNWDSTNTLKIYWDKLILSKNVEMISKKYGVSSYILLILIIVIINVSIVPENTIDALSWAMIR